MILLVNILINTILFNNTVAFNVKLGLELTDDAVTDVDVKVAERRAYHETKPPDTMKDPAPRSINPNPVVSVFANRRGKT